ncbi:CRISPR-associated endonuclease Cas3'' [Myxococcaceae bacterium JPH2]|nr:CRISPR-associated endonuclease Cas3'' [Myxococcaceae bacterium JPH2]
MKNRQPDTGAGEAPRAKPPEEPLAHATRDGRFHSLWEHLEAVGKLAASLAPRPDLAGAARAAGLWHDLGKYLRDFQFRIRSENGFEAHLEKEGELERDHSTAGGLWALRRDARWLPLALAILGHHSGLSDLAKFKARISNPEKKALLEEVLKQGVPADLLDTPVALDIQKLLSLNKLQLEMWTRMLFSVLCDADFLDSESFFDPDKHKKRKVEVTLAQLAGRLRAYLDEKQSGARDTEVNRVRREVLSASLSAAAQAPGVFSLTVPTGGGKTLTSMAFALEHALAHGHPRVIVAIPYTSIIEQSAEVYRQAFAGLESGLIEHHSAIDPERETALNRVASENWDAPVVVTTTVQLLESLFANRPGACRKLHRIARSVIVLDEAQTLPPGLLDPILSGLQALVADYGCSVVISTATQPALGQRAGLPLGFPHVRELVPTELRAFERLRRVKVSWPKPEAAPMSYEALAESMAGERDVLAIVHRRDDARKLCELVDARLGSADTVHLSALMCPAHRSAVIADIKACKARGEPVRVVATQLVEAGVDLDFAIVYRALGGLDSIAQAAGRCNREGLLDGVGELRVFEAVTRPPRGVPQAAQDVTRSLLAQRPDLDLSSPENFRLYFERLFANQKLDAKGIQELRANLSFKEVAQRFQLVENDWSAALVVPHEGVEPHIQALREWGPSRERLRALQRFTVTVPRKVREEWLAGGMAELIHDTVTFLGTAHRSAYGERFGLVPDQVGLRDPSSLIPA